MAKRFTDTNKYKKPFVRGLKGAYKLFWDFLYHDCDHSGIWIVDIDIAQIYLGSDMKITEKDALKYFNTDEQRVVVIEDGKKWFIPSFIDFQYGILSETNRAHTGVINNLKKYNLLDYNKKTNKPLASPLQGDKDMDKDKEQVKEQEEPLFLLKTNEDMVVIEMNNIWKRYKPNYSFLKEVDYPAFLNIAYYIAERKGIMKNEVVGAKEKQVLESFDKIAKFLSETDDKFFKRLTLDGIAISKNMQKIEESMRISKEPVKETKKQETRIIVA